MSDTELRMICVGCGGEAGNCHMWAEVSGKTYCCDICAERHAPPVATPDPRIAAAEALADALKGITLDGFGIFDDPRGQRWRLSLPITEQESTTASIASKRAQIADALAAWEKAVR